MSVTIGVILTRKGTTVHTVAPTTTVGEAARQLTQHGIGALVVSADGREVAGVVSERDIVRSLAESGAAALEHPVSDLMTADVLTCSRSDTADDLLSRMTAHRVRHFPVLDDGHLAGLVSIGDCVKARIDDLEMQTESLQSYVSGTSY